MPQVRRRRRSGRAGGGRPGPARTGATAYTLAWAPTNAQLPASPGDCVSPCRKRTTSATAMTLLWGFPFLVGGLGYSP